MKKSTLVLVFVVVLLVTSLADAKKKNKRGKKKNKCSYERSIGACDVSSNKRPITMTLTEEKDGCQATKTKSISCDKCVYNAPTVSECVDDKITKTWDIPSEMADNPNCQAKQKVLACGGKRKQNKNKEGKAGCQYNEPQPGECRKNRRLMTKTLSADNTGVDCDPELSYYQRDKTCRKGGKNKKGLKNKNCKYEKAVGECVDGKKTLTFTLSEDSDPISCSTRPEKQIRCDKGNKNKRNKKDADENLKGPSEICLLPMQKGMCRAIKPRWYYNSETQQCERFNYGGCQGNENNFVTEDECNNECTGMQNEQSQQDSRRGKKRDRKQKRRNNRRN